MTEIFFDFEIKGQLADGINILERYGGEGKSGYGEVYLVHVEKINKIIALKKLQDSLKFDKEKHDEFIKEGIVSSKFKHPNIVKSMGITKIDNDFFIIQEPIFKINGKHDLNDYFSEINDKRIVDWSIQFCYAMEYANSNGINAHRDIKPSNILILFDELKICDFGLVDLIEKYSTDVNMYPGTFEYSAPESFNKQYSIQSDIYSYGLVLYQMINNGDLPFEFKGNNPQEWKELHETYELPYFESVFYPIVKKCLNKNPEERYNSFEELRYDFESIYKKFSDEVYIPQFDEKNSMDYIAEGSAYLFSNDLESAEVYFEKAIDLDDKNINTFLNIGIILIDRGFSNKAIEYLNICEELVEDNVNETAAVFFNLGHAHHGINFEKSIYYYEKCIENDEKYLKAYVNLGNIYKNEFEDYDKSLEYYNHVLEKRPNCVEALMNKAVALYKLGKYEESEEYFKKALKCNEKMDTTYSEWGKCLRENNNEIGAKEKFIEANKINPLSSSNNHDIFISHLILGEKIFAKNRYHRIVELNDDNITIKLRLIKEFDEYGYFNEAINLLDNIIFEKENEEIALITKAELLIMHNKYSEASIIINKLINETKDDFILSASYDLKGRMSNSYEDALNNFNKSLKYNPNNINVHFQIGKLYLDEGLIDEAMEIYNKIL
ncbi:MAG: protein kinase [Methanobrevibacter sp.]|nr:protein kinase [Methanobrevibacter sp.]